VSLYVVNIDINDLPATWFQIEKRPVLFIFLC